MRTTVPLLLICGFLLAGCGTKANPMNWFGNDVPDESVLEPIENTNPLIPERTGLFDSRNTPQPYLGSPINEIVDVTLERVPGGLIVRATGRSATLGAYNARLTPATADGLPVDGILAFRLEAQYVQASGGAPETREVVVARRFTDQELTGTRRIRVEGLQNAVERGR